MPHKRGYHGTPKRRNKAARAHLSVDRVTAALTENRGMLQHAAETLRVTRRSLREFVERNDACAAVLFEAREAMGDVAERKLFEKIEAGDVRCIMYYLSTVHRNRGYGMRKDESSPFGANPVFVETVNVVAVPRGQFVPADQAMKEIAAPDEIVHELPDTIEATGDGRTPLIAEP